MAGVKRGRRKAAAGWTVANPRGIPAGIPVIRWADRAWYEGDAFEAPDGLDPARLIAQGYLVPAETGAGNG